jgi:hypothetical protein
MAGLTPTISTNKIRARAGSSVNERTITRAALLIAPPRSVVTRAMLGPLASTRSATMVSVNVPSSASLSVKDS